MCMKQKITKMTLAGLSQASYNNNKSQATIIHAILVSCDLVKTRMNKLYNGIYFVHLFVYISFIFQLVSLWGKYITDLFLIIHFIELCMIYYTPHKQCYQTANMYRLCIYVNIHPCISKTSVATVGLPVPFLPSLYMVSN